MTFLASFATDWYISLLVAVSAKKIETHVINYILNGLVFQGNCAGKPIQIIQFDGFSPWFPVKIFSWRPPAVVGSGVVQDAGAGARLHLALPGSFISIF